MLLQRQETEQDLNQQVQKCRTEKQVLVERVSSLSRTLTSMDTEKLEAERSSHRLEKDKNALMKTLDKVVITVMSSIINFLLDASAFPHSQDQKIQIWP